MKRYLRSTIIQPAYHLGEVVYRGDAHSYHCTSEIYGDIKNFPNRLAKYVRNIYYLGDNTYKVEWLMDEGGLFDENYRNFFDKITRILEEHGLQAVD